MTRRAWRRFAVLAIFVRVSRNVHRSDVIKNRVEGSHRPAVVAAVVLCYSLYAYHLKWEAHLDRSGCLFVLAKRPRSCNVDLLNARFKLRPAS
ncbi:hypothetical protein PUN28_006054 [Cardiocondyla obscurior]|uniref:Secreted protein n=1 Tax=Cardiocondyla obscurior TaxID=286306 RepID=A0AAW2G9T3_9HYME